MTEQNIEQLARTQMRQFLPNALRCALQSYRTFITSERKAEESKNYGEHQKAAKHSASHIDLLFKLVQKIEKDGELSESQEEDDLRDLINRAKSNVNAYLAAHPDDDLA